MSGQTGAILPSVHLVHVPRAQNAIADQLAKGATHATTNDPIFHDRRTNTCRNRTPGLIDRPC